MLISTWSAGFPWRSTPWSIANGRRQSKLALIHFWAANAGAILLNLGVYGLMSGNTALAPVAVVGSLVTIAGMLIFAFIVYTKV